MSCAPSPNCRLRPRCGRWDVPLDGLQVFSCQRATAWGVKIQDKVGHSMESRGAVGLLRPTSTSRGSSADGERATPTVKTLAHATAAPAVAAYDMAGWHLILPTAAAASGCLLASAWAERTRHSLHLEAVDESA